MPFGLCLLLLIADHLLHLGRFNVGFMLVHLDGFFDHLLFCFRIEGRLHRLHLGNAFVVAHG